MANFKRGLSFLLSLVLVFSVLPVFAQATESQTAEPQAMMDNNDVTVEGTNSVGMLLSEQLQAYQQEQLVSTGSNVTGLEVVNGVATVEFRTLEQAILIVGVYDEAGIQLLASGWLLVEPDDTAASVTLEGQIPKYFEVSAYLVDTYDYSPLCTAYRSVLYTKEIQALLASTTATYKGKKLLQLDDSTTTNFAVYSDSTIVLEQQEGVNTLVSADDQNSTYVIGNPDDTVKGLQAGDIFVLPYADYEVLVVKVGTITVSGSTATITGVETQLEEVFSHVKVEVGDEFSNGGSAATRAHDFEDSWSKSIEVPLAEQEYKVESGIFNASMKISGSLSLGVSASLKYYYSSSRQFAEFKVDYDLELTGSAEGEFVVSVKLPEFELSACGVSIGFNPKLKLEFNGEVSVFIKATSTLGFSYEKGQGFKDLSSAPHTEKDVNIDAKVFFGVDLCPSVEVGGVIIDLELQMPIGFELNAELTGQFIDGNQEGAECIHGCMNCVAMELYAKAEFSVKVTFLGWIEAESKAFELKYKLADMYWSIDKNEFDLGTCPQKGYRTTIHVTNRNGDDAGQAPVIAHNDDHYFQYTLADTNENGMTTGYLIPGEYTISSFVDGYGLETYVEIKEEASKIELSTDNVITDLNQEFLKKFVSADSVTDASVVARGKFGDNIYWVLDKYGIMQVKGRGEFGALVASVIPDSIRPKIKTLMIEEGITDIGLGAFSECVNMTSVVLPDTVGTIETSAFRNCTSLAEINMPEYLLRIDNYAFEGCVSLKEVIMWDNVRTIGTSAFKDCESLQTVLLSDSLESIGHYAFQNCSSLKAVRLPDSVVSIGHSLFENCTQLSYARLSNNLPIVHIYMFRNCPNLTAITIPDSVTEISMGAFSGSGLKSVTIPASVKEIKLDAFNSCLQLAQVQLSEGLKTVGNYAFSNCPKLTHITIPTSVTALGDAFASGIGLQTILFRGDAPSFGFFCFSGLKLQAYYPNSFYTWTENDMQNYWGTVTWISYDPLKDDPISIPTAVATVAAQETAPAAKKPATRAIYGGEYDTDITEEGILLKTASFSGLVAGEEYLLLALASLEAEEPLAADNLLAINQGQAGEDGTLVFTYVQRVDTTVSYVMACGASNRNLQDAVITFPAMSESEEAKAVDPVVTYDGQVLTEGLDYTVSGTVDYTEAGIYTCYVRGIYNYTGLVECTYTVTDATLTETADYLYLKLNGDCQVVPELNKDLYIDLNGYDLSGTIITNGYTVYGMDSTTDNYTCENIGYFNCVDESGNAIVPVTHFKSNITGATKRYMAIKTDEGYSFHRFYMGVTHQSLRPATSSVGYKGVFYGDSMVIANLDSFGFTMQLGSYSPKVITKTGGFVSGKTVTLRIDNFDVENYGETELFASAALKLSDGTVIESTRCVMTLRVLLEALNENHTSLTADQLTAVADFIKKYAIIGTWKVENLM